MNIGFDRPLYILPFDHRGSFQTKLFGWKGKLTPEQTAEIAAAKQVIYDGFKAAVAAGVPKDRAGVLADEHEVASEVVVEWRALTVAMLDRTAERVRSVLGLSASELPLAKVLEGGTWRAGRELAAEKRAGGGPPLRVRSDGTVF